MVDLRFDADSADLHDHLTPITQLGSVDLGNRRSGNGLSIEVGEELVDRLAECAFNLPDRLPR